MIEMYYGKLGEGMSYHDLAILRRPDVERLTGLPRSSIYRQMAEGVFPRPVSLGARSVGWKFADIRQWLEARSLVGTNEGTT